MGYFDSIPNEIVTLIAIGENIFLYEISVIHPNVSSQLHCIFDYDRMIAIKNKTS